MNVKCPYCGCSYDIDTSSLSKPTVDHKLGYGWWLICYHCSKKWWLKNYSVQRDPVKADKDEMLVKLSNFKIRAIAKNKPYKKASNAAYYYCGTAAILAFVYFVHYEHINNFLNEKMYSLSANLEHNLSLLNVRYSINNAQNPNDIEVVVSGSILNRESRIVALTGIKIVVSDNNGKQVASWIEPMHISGVMPGNSVPFVTKHTLSRFNENLHVNVYII